MDEVELGITMQEAAFVHGAQAFREMIARFIENGPPTEPKALACSVRANWVPGWGVDPGPLKGSIPHSALGETPEFYERNFPSLTSQVGQGDSDG
jgi:hypothetical protein